MASAARFRSSVEALSPAYFAMVMATGIVSTAAWQLGMTTLGEILFLLNVVVYLALLLLNGLRIAWAPRRMIGDMTDHQRGPGFFTIVAASCVLGSQCVIIAGQFAAAGALLVVGAFCWLALMYTIFTAFTVKRTKPTLAEGITGAWLLAVVATQAIAVLGSLMVPQLDATVGAMANFLALSMWLFGGMLYIWMISLIFYRYTFFPFSPADLTPPYWINMGAMAISTLAGARLIGNAASDPLLDSMLPFVKGFTVLFWATGTWWIPMLVLLGVWRHVRRRFPLRYHPLYWGAVFPLGMYTVATLQMSRALGIGYLETIPRVMVWVAIVAWAAAFAGWLFTIASSAFRRDRAAV